MDKLQKLLSAKKHETPGKEYFDNFLEEFHDYQRVDLLAQNFAQKTFRQKIADFLEDFFVGDTRRAFALGSAAATCAIVFAFVLLGGLENGGQSDNLADASNTSQSTAANESRFVFVTASGSDHVDSNGYYPEIKVTSTSFNQDFKNPEYVTGENEMAYDNSIVF